MKGLKNKITAIILGAYLLFSLAPGVLATDISSSSFIVKDPVIDSGSKTSTSTNFGAGQSISQTAIGKSTSGSFQLLSGFQYFFQASPNILTATAGNAQVSLSWTVPQTYLGVQVGSYDVGVGTSSGSYTFQSVGNVTSYTKTGLSNGTTYYFKIKAKTAAGTFLVFSNEASALPSGSGNNDTGGGGGGGNSGNGAGVIFSGLTSPSAQIFIIQDSHLAIQAAANLSGEFSAAINNLNPGSYNFFLYSQDIEGGRSSFVSLQLKVNPGVVTQVNNLIMPPSIKEDKAEVKQGDPLNISGFSVAGSTVAISVTGKSNFDFSATANSSGRYVFAIPTANLDLSQYEVKTKAIIGSSASIFSLLLNFLVGTKNVPAPVLGQCPQRADYNQDCKVNLVDFSIQAYWYKKLNPPPDIDLNSDGVVDLTDFSILAYYWTG